MKFSKFTLYNELLPKYKENYNIKIGNFEEICVMEWNWVHDNVHDVLYDITQFEGEDKYRAIFNNRKEILIRLENEDFIVENKVISKRLDSFKHIIEFDCTYEDHKNCILNYEVYENYKEYEDDKEVTEYNKSIINDPLEKEAEEENCEIHVVLYDYERQIYREIFHNFLLRQNNAEVFCIGKLVNKIATALSDNDKEICDSLKILY